MIKLYQLPTSPFTEKVRRALNYKGIEFEFEDVSRMKVAQGEYKHVSPTGKFPAIMDGDKAVWDSTDIIYHLEDNHSGATLVPDDPRDAAIAHAIEEWADESLYFYEMTMRLTWEHNLDAALDEFAATMPQIPKEQLRPMIMENAGQLTQAQGLGRKPREQVIADLDRHLKSLDALLEGRSWLVGDHVSIADVAVMGQLTALRYAEETQTALKQTSNILDWCQRLDDVAPTST